MRRSSTPNHHPRERSRGLGQVGSGRVDDRGGHVDDECGHVDARCGTVDEGREEGVDSSFDFVMGAKVVRWVDSDVAGVCVSATSLVVVVTGRNVFVRLVFVSVCLWVS